MTNGEWLRGMSDEELAFFLTKNEGKRLRNMNYDGYHAPSEEYKISLERNSIWIKEPHISDGEYDNMTPTQKYISRMMSLLNIFGGEMAVGRNTLNPLYYKNRKMQKLTPIDDIILWIELDDMIGVSFDICDESGIHGVHGILGKDLFISEDDLKRRK
jgi:hypothetical protein